MRGGFDRRRVNAMLLVWLVEWQWWQIKRVSGYEKMVKGIAGGGKEGIYEV